MEICISQMLVTKTWLKKIVNKYLGHKNNDVDNRLFNFKRSIKNLVNIDEKINATIDDYKPNTETKYDNKKELLAFQINLESLCLTCLCLFIMKLFLF